MPQFFDVSTKKNQRLMAAFDAAFRDYRRQYIAFLKEQITESPALAKTYIPHLIGLAKLTPVPSAINNSEEKFERAKYCIQSETVALKKAFKKNAGETQKIIAGVVEILEKTAGQEKFLPLFSQMQQAILSK